MTTEPRAGLLPDGEEWITAVIDAIPPKEWRVTVWEQPSGEPRTGPVDGAHKRALVKAIVQAYADEIPGPPVTGDELRALILARSTDVGPGTS